MDVIHPRCGGLDVHKASVVAVARLQEGAAVLRHTRKFGTTTRELLALLQWLSELGVTHVVMEATGVYWKPVWHILEGHFELTLANAREVRNVPGRKRDVNDATWLADLLANGLVRASLVPPRPLQQLRELTRTRKQLTRQIAQASLRIQKILEGANIKLGNVISDVLGVSGRAMVRGIVRGISDPEQLVSLSTGRLTATKQDLLEALTGAVTDHHRFLLTLHLEQIEHLERLVGSLEAEIERQLRPFRRQVEALSTIPGVREIAASVILAETGADMTRFPSPAHLVSWTGLCQRLDESAGKQRSKRLRKGARWLKTTIIQCAWAAVAKRNTYARAKFQRLRARVGANKAIVAIASDIMTAVYFILRDGAIYRELGPDHFVADRRRAAKNLVSRLRRLGFSVTLTEAVA
jgi:transposase